MKASHLGLALLLSTLVANVADALPTSFTGTLRVEMGPGGTTLFDQATSGTGTADVTYAAGDVDSIANLGAGAFSFAGPTFVISDPNLAPVLSIRLDASNGTGTFSGLTTGGGGSMGLLGQFTAEVFSPGNFVDLLTADGTGHGIGLGGSFIAGLPFHLFASPWTVGTATNSYGTRSGFSAGNSIRLVSPFSYTASGISSTEGFAILDLTMVPEPGEVALLGIGLVVLAIRRH